VRIGCCVLTAVAATWVTAVAWGQSPVGSRVEAYVPYDGSGRYTLSQDDGVRGIQGLAELAERLGVKPYADLSTGDGTWRTERVIFRDVDTGATVVRLTNDPWADQLSYFRGNWSADGEYIVFRRRPGMWEASTDTHGPMAMRSDGTGVRNVFRQYGMVRNEVCSPAEPGICYAMADDRRVVAFDLATGATHHVVRDVPGCWHLKVSLDGRYLMGRSDLESGGRGFWIVSSDGREYHEIPIPESIHDSYQFHPVLPRCIMYWYEDRYRTEGFVQRDFEGGPETKIPVLFDWNHGDVGLNRGAHCEGYITRIVGNAWGAQEPLFAAPGVEYYDDPADCNGYLTWWPKDQLWVYSTRIARRPYISEIHCFHADPVPGDVANRYRVCYTGVMAPGCLDNPGASPDGTKVLFNSNMLGSVDAYYVVAHLPEPPAALAAGQTAGAVRLTWAPPVHHAEIAGYRVYRSAESGTGYERITPRPVAATEYVDEEAPTTGPCFYAVTAVEHSGLESRLSREAALSGNQPAYRRLFIEAEEAERSPEVWLALQGLASNLHYVWMRKRAGVGRLTVPIELPPSGRAWQLWARVKGPEGASFTAELRGQALELRAPPSAAWSWSRFAGTFPAGSPGTTLALQTRLYGSALDCLVLTDDPDYTPDLALRVRCPGVPPVTGLRAAAISPYAVRLSWDPVTSPTLHHYSVYCGHDAAFTADQASLVASPDRADCVDWGLHPGETLFYRVSAVDDRGNEGPVSEAAAVTVPAVERVMIQQDGAAEVHLQVPTAGTYVVWLKLKRGEGGGEYINVALDGDSRTWTCAFDGLSDESWFTYDQWGRFDLGAGAHTLTLDNRTAHTVQSVLVTNDLSLRAEGHVNILSGW